MQLLAGAQSINGTTTLIVASIPNASADTHLRHTMDWLKKKTSHQGNAWLLLLGIRRSAIRTRMAMCCRRR